VDFRGLVMGPLKGSYRMVSREVGLRFGKKGGPLNGKGGPSGLRGKPRGKRAITPVGNLL